MLFLVSRFGPICYILKTGVFLEEYSQLWHSATLFFRHMGSKSGHIPRGIATFSKNDSYWWIFAENVNLGPLNRIFAPRPTKLDVKPEKFGHSAIKFAHPDECKRTWWLQIRYTTRRPQIGPLLVKMSTWDPWTAHLPLGEHNWSNLTFEGLISAPSGLQNSVTAASWQPLLSDFSPARIEGLIRAACQIWHSATEVWKFSPRRAKVDPKSEQFCHFEISFSHLVLICLHVRV